MIRTSNKPPPTPPAIAIIVILLREIGSEVDGVDDGGTCSGTTFSHESPWYTTVVFEEQLKCIENQQ
jgi:hypothetical protein